MIDIRVIIPAYNPGAMLVECLSSLAAQAGCEWAAVLVDDASDNSWNGTWPGYGEHELSACYRDMRGGELAGIIDGMPVLACGRLGPLTDATVVVHLCADDYLPAPDVLSRLAAVYEDPDVWMTYGGYAFEDGTRGHCREYPPEAHTYGDYRVRPWQASHLRSYRYGLWRRIPPEQFIDPATGATWFYATDRAMMLPMLEMAREHARFMPCDPPLYTYRRHPGNVPSFMDAGHCERVAGMPRLERVETIYV